MRVPAVVVVLAACGSSAPAPDALVIAAFTPDPAGAYDDCGQNLFCYEGTCHALCLDGSALPLGGEYPPEVILCD